MLLYIEFVNLKLYPLSPNASNTWPTISAQLGSYISALPEIPTISKASLKMILLASLSTLNAANPPLEFYIENSHLFVY